jgi:cob(I)alamin adenosyltransferase
MDKSRTLLKGKECLKSSPVFDALGDLDELNCALGIVRSKASLKINRQILKIQDDLIQIGGFLATNQKIDFSVKTLFLEKEIKKIADQKVKTFSRPGKNQTSAFLHLSRALCRRLERRIIGLKKKNFKDLVSFLDSLSNFIFWLAVKEEKK